jgi:drug/metabolite transporter (DMT)-like permease
VPSRSYRLLITAALCWGSSFAFMKLAIAELTPTMLMASRCAIGAAVLWAWIAWTRANEPVDRREQVRLVANGAMTAAPFVLIAWGLLQVDSGVVGIVNASVPIWSTLLALRWDREHQTTAGRIVGALVGFSGIVLLFATHGLTVSAEDTLALVACATGSLLYAISGIFVREQLPGHSGAIIAAWSILWAALLLAPAALVQLPIAMPSAGVLVSVVILGVMGTGAGMLAYYQLIVEAGAARAALVTYLLPPLALISGWLLLDEKIGIDALAAMALILLGVWLASRPTRVPAIATEDAAG